MGGSCSVADVNCATADEFGLVVATTLVRIRAALPGNAAVWRLGGRHEGPHRTSLSNFPWRSVFFRRGAASAVPAASRSRRNHQRCRGTPEPEWRPNRRSDDEEPCPHRTASRILLRVYRRNGSSNFGRQSGRSARSEPDESEW